MPNPTPLIFPTPSCGRLSEEGLHPSREGLGDAVQQDQLQPRKVPKTPENLPHFSTFCYIFPHFWANFDSVI